MNLKSVIERIKRGDKAAFAELYDQCAPHAYGLAVRILKNEVEAQDILQLAFISLWTNIKRFDPERSQVTTWLYVFVRNRCIDLIRKKKRHSTVSLLDDEAEILEDRPDEIDERTHLVTKALEELPDGQKSVIEAAYFDGLTQEEIAAKFDEPLGTIKTRMRLGMIKLAQSLKFKMRVLNES